MITNIGVDLRFKLYLLNVAGDAVVGPVELAALAGVVRPVQEVEQEEGQGEE